MKKLTTGEVNLMKKFGIENVEAEVTCTRTNPMSGESAALNPAAAKMYDLIQMMYQSYNNGGPFKVQDFDRLRMLFLKFWRDSYNTLLD